MTCLGPFLLLLTELKMLRSTGSFRRDLKTFLFHSVYGCVLGLLVGGAIQVPQLQLQLQFSPCHHHHTRTLSAFPRDRLSTLLVNSAAKIFRLSLGCHPLDDVTRAVLPQGQYWIEYLSTTNNSNYQYGRC